MTSSACKKEGKAWWQIKEDRKMTGAKAWTMRWTDSQGGEYKSVSVVLYDQCRDSLVG